VDNLPSNWGCPQHACHTCERKSAAVGGVLFRCETCPVTYCEDCLTPFARDNITNQCPRYALLGQRHPKTACFMLCNAQCVTWHKTPMYANFLTNLQEEDIGSMW
jgi:SWI/SNF-related matrix-associated actin-dependent regulator of chromatin subfamily A member 5